MAENKVKFTRKTRRGLRKLVEIAQQTYNPNKVRAPVRDDIENALRWLDQVSTKDPAVVKDDASESIEADAVEAEEAATA
jgi:phosphoenolpyruvate carboxylase